jgi:hypothetical protein
MRYPSLANRPDATLDVTGQLAEFLHNVEFGWRKPGVIGVPGPSWTQWEMTAVAQRVRGSQVLHVRLAAETPRQRVMVGY